MRLPQTVGEYRLIERIGGGAFGTVYRAEIEGSQGFKQECAVKLLDAGRAADEPEEVAALADEARILSRLHHPAIVHVRRFVELSHEFLGDTWGLEMELVRGVTLDRVIAVQDRLSVPAVVGILAELLEGLHYAHNAKGEDGEPLGLVHRDLKPENIVITHEGRLKLLDFGIARAEGRTGLETAVGETKGTPLYMSPEQLRGEALTGASDLYAVGTLAYELLTPERYVHLEEAPDVQAVLIAVSETVFEDRRGLLDESLAARPALSDKQAARLSGWVGALLHHEEIDRTKSAAEALDSLTSLSALYKPHRARELLKGVVDELAASPPDPEPTPRPSMASAGPTQLVPSSGPRTDGGDASDWLVGVKPLPEIEDADIEDLDDGDDEIVFRSSWVPIALAVVLGAGLLLTVLQLIGGGSDSATVVPVVVSSDPIGDETRSAAPDATEDTLEESAPADEEASTPAGEVADEEAETPAATDEPTPAAAPAPKETKKPLVVASGSAWEAAPVVKLTHTPPKVAVAGSPLKFKATVEGDCTPRVFWGAVEGPLGGRATFDFDGGTAWSTTIQIPYDAAHASGVRYYLTCCTGSGACPASFKSAASPQVVPAPAF